MVSSGMPESKHFKIEQLADGVYAAIASEQGYAICNAGIIDIGDRAIIFDTFISPEAARDLPKVATQLTGRRISDVVNSHEHNDHIRGNQIFGPDVNIISTARIRERISRNEPKDIEWEKETVPKEIVDTKLKLGGEKDNDRRRELASMLVYLQAMSKSHSELKTRLPNITFGHKLTLHGTKREVELIPLAGHTTSDVILHLPEEKIVFMGDLLFVRCHPYLASGSPRKWKQSITKTNALGIKIAVPGHGPVGQSGDLSTMSKYIQSLENIAMNMVESGKPVEQASLQPIPSPFDKWKSHDSFFVSNLEFLYGLAADRRERD